MFDATNVNDLMAKTAHWQAMQNQHITENNIDELRHVLRFHEYRYYVVNNPLIADYEYDMLYKKLEAFEKANPLFITSDSPTQRVGKGLIKNFAKAQHLVPMLSLDNSYNAADLIDFDRKVKELSGKDVIEYCVEPKFDGASISLVYENNQLVRGITRGDGEVGDDITPNVHQIKSIPLHANFSQFGIEQIEIRGEVLMNKNNFAQYNQTLIDEGLPPLANPRNAAAGTLRMKDPSIVSKRNLEAFLYHVSFVSTYKDGSSQVPSTHSGFLQMLWAVGMKSPKNEMRTLKGIDAVINYINDFEAGRDALPYEIDGMVIKVNDIAQQDQLGMTSHHPRWAIAYKFKARQATSKLLGVEFQVGRTGAVTPVAKIAAAQVGGVTVTSISIHNDDYIKEKDLKIGDTILIERSGDVIPQIVKSLTELRDGSQTDIVFPQQCPVCNDVLVRPEGEAVWRCVNINCEAQVVERMIHFVSKDAMDIKSFGEANVRKFFAAGIIKDVPSIYKITATQLQQLEGFGEKSVTNLLAAIEASKQQPLHRVIYGLGIRYVGETTAKTLAQSIDTIFDLASKSKEELQQMDDVGVKVAESIASFFTNQDNIDMLQALSAAGLQMKGQPKELASTGLAGQTFLFTGTLNKLKRSDAEALAESHGGTILSGVSSKLNYLVVGADAGSKLEKAKKIATINIISEDDFINMMNQ
ncbi:NAD-dependent DNA ligase LigA [Ferruginibacter yonginensis]|uniref:DNA ligase n=1 Tax=Ferruginibacter yonginensis TaxID=1310416 RepID=A0ABV8QTZ7_9BACT